MMVCNDRTESRDAIASKNLKLRNNAVDVSPTQTHSQDICTNMDEKIERGP